MKASYRQVFEETSFEKRCCERPSSSALDQMRVKLVNGQLSIGTPVMETRLKRL